MPLRERPTNSSKVRVRKKKLVEGEAAASTTLEPDLRAARAVVLELMPIAGVSGRESGVSDFIVKRLKEAGADPSGIAHDDVFRRSPLEGDSPSLIFQLPGTVRGPWRLLMAHMDTVPLCVGSKPTVRDGRVTSADRRTGLGADDRAGCAVILTAAIEILRRKLPHPPLTFFWPVQEEVGLHGSHFANLKLLGKPKLAFNWDGGSAEKISVGATGAFRMSITVTGLASHAGGAPEMGVSAVTIAALATAELHREGWLGLVIKGNRRGTSNIGVVRGGAATNVVTDHMEIKAEVRSHDPKFREEILKQFERAFQRAAAEVASAAGVRGSVSIDSRLDYEAFALQADEPCVVAAEAAIRVTGGQPVRAISNGGLDANWMTARGIPTATLGCGQQNPHTVNEALNLAEFERACRVALRLATATESA